MTEVVLGEKSSKASYQSLIDAGLLQLYPELDAANDRRDPRLNLTTVDLRAFWFRSTSKLTATEILIATRVASRFIAVKKGADGSNTHLLTWLLAMKRRDTDDDALKACLGGPTLYGMPGPRHSIDAEDEDLKGACAELPELREYQRLKASFANRKILAGAIDESASVPASQVEEAVGKWRTWHKASRKENRAPRADRSHKPRRRRTDRSRSRRKQLTRRYRDRRQ